MPIQFTEANGGKILIVYASGMLVQADYANLVPEFARLVQQHGKLRVLFVMTNFHGWDAGAAWADLKLGLAHFAHIKQLALVGDKTWQKGMAVFCRPFTKAKVKYFDHTDDAKARKWIGVTP